MTTIQKTCSGNWPFTITVEIDPSSGKLVGWNTEGADCFSRLKLLKTNFWATRLSYKRTCCCDAIGVAKSGEGQRVVTFLKFPGRCFVHKHSLCNRKSTYSETRFFRVRSAFSVWEGFPSTAEKRIVAYPVAIGYLDDFSKPASVASSGFLFVNNTRDFPLSRLSSTNRLGSHAFACSASRAADIACFVQLVVLTPISYISRILPIKLMVGSEPNSAMLAACKASLLFVAGQLRNQIFLNPDRPYAGSGYGNSEISVLSRPRKLAANRLLAPLFPNGFQKRQK